MRIQSSGGLNDDQISQMVKDAETYAEKDKERKELIEVGNRASSRMRLCVRACVLACVLPSWQSLDDSF